MLSTCVVTVVLQCSTTSIQLCGLVGKCTKLTDTSKTSCFEGQQLADGQQLTILNWYWCSIVGISFQSFFLYSVRDCGSVCLDCYVTLATTVLALDFLQRHFFSQY